MDFFTLGQWGSRDSGWSGQASGPSRTTDTSRFASQRSGAARASGTVSSASPPAELRIVTVNPNFVGEYAVLGLLDQLSNVAPNAAAQYRVAALLTRLGRVTQGNLDNLPGAREVVDDWLDGRPSPDLWLMRLGPLGDPVVCAALVAKLGADSYDQAVSVLNQVTLAYRQKLTELRISQSLNELVELLPNPEKRGYEKRLNEMLSDLCEELCILDIPEVQGRWPAVDMLDFYLQSLPARKWESLLIALRPGRLDAVHVILSRVNKRPPPQLECVLFPFIALKRLRASLDRELYARAEPDLRSLHEALDQAARPESGHVAYRVMRALHILGDRIRQTYGQLPEKLAEEVRKLAVSSLGVYLDAKSRQTGSPDESNLQDLYVYTLHHLRRISSSLRPWGLGLDLDIEALKAVGLQHVDALRRQAVEGMMAMLRTLSEEAVDMPALMRQLGDLAGVELQRIQQLEDLGQSGSGGIAVDDLDDKILEMGEQAMTMLLEEGPAVSADIAMRHVGLMREMAKRYFVISDELKNAIAQRDYREGGRKIESLLFISAYLLGGMCDAMHEKWATVTGASLSDRTQRGSADSAASFSPGIFDPILRAQYGLAYSPTTHAVTLSATDSARARMAPALTSFPSAADCTTQEVTLPVNGTEGTFTVDTRFHAHGIEGASVFLSVRGIGADGQGICVTWPNPAFPHDRRLAMGRALDALGQVAGVRAEALTHLMGYEHVYAAVIQGLQAMGADSPFRLPEDGAIVHLEGGGTLEFDVAQTEDGGFLIATTVGFLKIASVQGTRPDGTTVGISMNPWASWARVQYTLHVSANLRQIRLSEAPQFRHHFDVTTIRELTTT
ncbi:hypothetical protein [Alcaligenes sp. Marseille-Q7550]